MKMVGFFCLKNYKIEYYNKLNSRGTKKTVTFTSNRSEYKHKRIVEIDYNNTWSLAICSIINLRYQ